jgi:hypothetical protein
MDPRAIEEHREPDRALRARRPGNVAAHPESFEHSAHMPNTEERDRFNEHMIEKVLPVAPARRDVLAFVCFHPSAALLFGTRFVL